jgi:hypothetical protein
MAIVSFRDPWPAEVARLSFVVLLLAPLLVLPAIRLAAQTRGATDVAVQETGREPLYRRDDTGRVTVRATRLTTPLQIDGKLDEAVYSQIPPITDFIQNDPREGAPASEKTEMWLFYDKDNVYVVAKCWESQPEKMGASELRRDNSNIFQNDNFAWMFDTFHDRQNGIIFEVTVAGGRVDAQVTNERQLNTDWNPVWNTKTGKFDGGWVVEASLPFKSIRYPSGTGQIWGFQARRQNKWKNEFSFISPVPASTASGLMRVSLAATLVGLEAPPPARNLEIKPYVTSRLKSDLTAKTPVWNAVDGDVGVDVKYGVTQSLTLDLTYNPDFAQADADEQQVNLTRFSLFFPEKREFFLENQGLFSFGGAATSGTSAAASDTPVLFYSRRIGLTQGREVPLIGGGRLTGRVGKYSVGLIDVRTDSVAGTSFTPTNFGVFRVKRDVLRRSSIGAVFTERSVRESAAGANQAFGVDGAFTLQDDLVVNTYLARTQTDGVAGDDASYRAQLDYEGDRYGLQVERLMVGDNFLPDVGFARRDNMAKNFAFVRFSPRTKRFTRVRKFYLHGALSRIANRKDQLETRGLDSEFEIQFQNSDKFIAGYTDTLEFLPRPFDIAAGVRLPVGEYRYGSGRVGFNFGKQRKISGNMLAERGSFYDGDKTAFSVAQGLVALTSRFTIEPTLTLNRVTLREGAFTQTLVGSRVSFAATPLAFASALVQYNASTHAVSTNARLRWEYRPGSELFVVYNETRDTLVPSFPDLASRSVILKVNRLFRF